MFSYLIPKTSMSACTTSSGVITMCVLMHVGNAMIAMTAGMAVMKEDAAVGSLQNEI